MDRIKRLSFEVLNDHKAKFGEDFTENKKALNQISIIRSKGLKNKVAGYITINISSPNTEGLRDFHDQQEFEKLLTGINKIKKDKNIPTPIAVKLSPDINNNEISSL